MTYSAATIKAKLRNTRIKLCLIIANPYISSTKSPMWGA